MLSVMRRSIKFLEHSSIVGAAEQGLIGFGDKYPYIPSHVHTRDYFRLSVMLFGGFTGLGTASSLCRSGVKAAARTPAAMCFTITACRAQIVKPNSTSASSNQS